MYSFNKALAKVSVFSILFNILIPALTVDVRAASLNSENSFMTADSVFELMTGSYDNFENTGAFNIINTGSVSFDLTFPDTSRYEEIFIDLSYNSGSFLSGGLDNPTYSGSFVYSSGTTLSGSISESWLNMTNTFSLSGGVDTFSSGSILFDSMDNGFYVLQIEGSGSAVTVPNQDTISYEFIVDSDGSYIDSLSGTGNESGSTPPVYGIFDGPLDLTFQDGVNEIVNPNLSSTGNIYVNLTNDRPFDINNVLGFGIGFDNKFVIDNDNLEILDFSGSLNGKTCTGGPTIIQEFGFVGIECTLNSSLNFTTGAVLEFTLSGVTTPSVSGQYFVDMRIITASQEEFFGSEVNIINTSDSNAPSIVDTFVKGTNDIVLKFDEAIDLGFGTQSGVNVNITGLSNFGVWDDWETHKKIFINTADQTPGTTYNYTVTGVKDYNGNTAGTLSGSFVGFDTTSKGVDYIVPHDLSIGESSLPVDIYGLNDLFDTTVGNISVNMGSGFTVGAITKVTNNHISFNVDIASNVDVGGKDVTVTVSGTEYILYNGIFTQKNFGNYLNFFDVFTEDYDGTGYTGSLKIKFNSDLSSLTTTNFKVDKVYGTTAQTPEIDSLSTFNTGSIVQLDFTGVEAGVWYDLSFSGVTNVGGKEIDQFMKIGFDFFDAGSGNFDTKTVPPIVVDSFPYDGGYDMPVQATSGSGFLLEVYFDQELQEDVLTSANIKLKDLNNNVIPGTIAYEFLDGVYSKLSFTTTSKLDYSNNYYLSLSHSIKSVKGLGLVGNVPPSEGEGHKIYFTTMADYSEFVSGGGDINDGGMYLQEFYVQNTNPFPGALDIPYDAKLQVVFSDVISTSTVSSSSVILEKLNGNGTTTTVASTYSYDNTFTPKILYIDPDSDLDQGVKYRLTVKNTVKSIKGQVSDNPNYIVEFKTGNSAAAAIPLDIQWDYAEGDLSRIEVGFSNPINSSTITTNNVKLFNANGTKITIEAKYNPDGNVILIKPTTKLSENTDYKLMFKSEVKDILGNSISNASLSNGFSDNAGIIEKTYSIGTIDAKFNNLFVEDFFSTSNKIELKFNKDIATPTSISHYTIKYAVGFNMSSGGTPENYITNNGITVSLANATIKYDDLDHRLFIEGLNIPTSSSPLETILEITLNNVVDSLDSSNMIGSGIGVNQFHMPIFSGEIQDEFKGSSMAISMGANVTPQNNKAGKSGLYFIDFPISKQLFSGSTVEILFPNQFDVSNATLDLNSPANYVGNLVISGQEKFIVTQHSTKNALVYTITNAYAGVLGENGFIISDIKGIINPTQTKDTGYVVEISTLTSDGMVLDKFKSNPIYIKETVSGASSKVLSVQLKDKDGVNLSEQDIILHMHSLDGYEELTTNASGLATFTGELNQHYGISVDPFVQEYNGGNIQDSGYMSEGKYYDVFLDVNKTINITLKAENDTDEMISISGNINGLNGKDVTLWVAGPKGYFEKKLGILNSNTYAYNVKAPKNIGYVSMGINPSIKKDFEMSGNSSFDAPDWQSPKSINVNVVTSDITGKNFNISVPTIDLDIVVQDDNGKSISNAHIFVYSPSGDSMGLYGDTDTSGIKSFKVKEGTYTYGAFIDGLPPLAEKIINISGAGTFTGTLTTVLPTTQISGKVLNGSDPVSGVHVFAFNSSDGSYLNAMTDSAGKYILYVKSGIWTVGGQVDNYGPLDEKTITVAGESFANQNFSITTSNLSNVSGEVQDSLANPISGVNIIAEPTDSNYKNFSQVFTDDTGVYNIKLNDGTYIIKAFHPEYGEIGKISGVTVASGDLVGKDFTIGTLRSVDLSFTGSGLPSDLSNFEWFIDVFDKTNKIGFNKNITTSTGFTFDNVPDGTYELRVFIPGVGEVYENNNFIVDGNEVIEITLESSEKLVGVTGIVDNGTTVLTDAFIELRNSTTNVVNGLKSGSGGIFDIQVKPGDYTVLIKKPGYNSSDPQSITVTGAGFDMGTVSLIELSTLSDNIIFSGTVSSSSGSIVFANNAFINIQGLNNDSTDNNLWFGQSVDESGAFSFDLPTDYKWKAIVVADGHVEGEYDLGYMDSSSSTGFTLTYDGVVVQPKTTNLTPSQGGVVSDGESGIKLTLPSSALGNGVNAGTVNTKETKKVPTVPGFKTIGGKAKQITAFDSNGNSITNLNSDATLEFDYTSDEIIATKTGITVDEVRNMQIFYYDSSASSWISLPTIISFSGAIDIDNYSTGSALFSTAVDGNTIIVNMKAATDHFTDFAPGVSSSVSAATTSTPAPAPAPVTSGGSGGSSRSTVVVSNITSTGAVDTNDDITSNTGALEVSSTQSLLLKIQSNSKLSLNDKLAFPEITISDISNIIPFETPIFKKTIKKLSNIFIKYEKDFVFLEGVNDKLEQDFKEHYTTLILSFKTLESQLKSSDKTEFKKARNDAIQAWKNLSVSIKERKTLMNEYGDLKTVQYGEVKTQKINFRFEQAPIRKLQVKIDKLLTKKLNRKSTNAKNIIKYRNQLFLVIKELLKAKDDGDKIKIKKLQKIGRNVYKNLLGGIK